MHHIATESFWTNYDQLSAGIRRLADKNFILLKNDPHHPSLHFKKVGAYWSARAGADYRVLAVESPEGIAWFWIGPPSIYERLIRS